VTSGSEPYQVHALTGKTVIRRDSEHPDRFNFALYQTVNLNYFDLSVQSIVDVAEKWQDACESHRPFRSFPHSSPTSVVKWNERVPLSPPNEKELANGNKENIVHIESTAKRISTQESITPVSATIHGMEVESAYTSSEMEPAPTDNATEDETTEGYPARTLVRYVPASSMSVCMLTLRECDRYALSYVTAQGEGFLSVWTDPVVDDEAKFSVEVRTPAQQPDHALTRASLIFMMSLCRMTHTMVTSYSQAKRRLARLEKDWTPSAAVG
jgi:hypothetical protein